MGSQQYLSIGTGVFACALSAFDLTGPFAGAFVSVFWSVFMSPWAKTPGIGANDVNRFVDSAICIPSFCKSAANSFHWNAGYFGPLCQQEAFSICLKMCVVSLVAILLVRCGPPNIAGFIVSVLIWMPIYRVFGRWSRPNVCEELLKRIHPRLAYGNSTPTVIRISTRAWVSATLLHGSPGVVLRSMSHAVRGSPAVARLALKAPAASGVAACEAIAINDARMAALAQALPEILLAPPAVERNDSQATKDATGQINSWHGMSPA